MPRITEITGLEILDSRGRPTVKARCQLGCGACGSASVPSGASTGAAEAIELRDGDPSRYAGLGCRGAAQHVSGTIHTALAGSDFETQSEFDEALIELDGTPDKSRLGANALLAASLAFARAHAANRGVPLYRHLRTLVGAADPLRMLPRPTINLYSGGLHAGGQVPIQDVLVVPTSPTIDEVLAVTGDVYRAAQQLCHEKYSTRPLTADEGGLAPPFADAGAMLHDAVTAITHADHSPGEGVALAVDVASSHFYSGGRYRLQDRTLDSPGMIEQLTEWCETYPIVSLEDGLAEDDWAHWPELSARLGDRVRIVGDDLLCTNPERIQRAVDASAANTLLLKVNQIGTLTEAARACRLAREAGWMVTVSARSGETEDDWLADLAVAWSADQIKVGSITQSERLAKYNRLLEIQAETALPLVNWPGC